MEQYTAFAAWYDRMMGTVAYEDWERYLDGLLQEAGAKTVAECACGTGNLTWRLIKAGYSVTALDISEDMLLTAREKLRKMGLSCPFVREDIRTLSLHRPVDAVVAACDGVNYLTEGAEEFFAAAYRALKPGGILLFDVSSDYKLRYVLSGRTFGDTGADWGYVWENAMEPNSPLLEMELTCFVKQGTGYARFEETHWQRAYTKEELTKALERAGFVKIEVYEAFTRHAPGGRTERLQFAARRPKDLQ